MHITITKNRSFNTSVFECYKLIRPVSGSGFIVRKLDLKTSKG